MYNDLPIGLSIDLTKDEMLWAIDVQEGIKTHNDLFAEAMYNDLRVFYVNEYCCGQSLRASGYTTYYEAKKESEKLKEAYNDTSYEFDVEADFELDFLDSI